MRSLCIGVFVATLLLVVPSCSALYGKGSNVVQLTTKNFAENVFGSNEVWLVEFYAPWCGHCKNLAPHWEQAAAKLKGLVRVGAIDCDKEENKQMAGAYQVQGFPTIKVFGSDFSENPYQKGAPFKQPSDYQGQRTADAIVQHALAQLKYHGETVTDATLDKFLSKEGGKVLLFSDKKKTTSLYKALSGQFLGRLAFGQVHSSNAEAMSKFDVTSAPTVVVIKEDGSHEIYSGKLNAVDLANFLSEYAPAPKYKGAAPPPPPPPARKPEVNRANTQEELDKYCPGGICVIAFLNPEHEEHEKYLAALDEASKAHYKHFNFIWVDGLEHSAFASKFGTGEDLPSMVVYSPTKKAYTPFVGAFSGESVVNYLGKVLHGKKRSVPLATLPKMA